MRALMLLAKLSAAKRAQRTSEYPLLVSAPKMKDLRRCVRNEDDAASTLSYTYFRGALDVSKAGVSIRGASKEGEAKKMRFPLYFDCTLPIPKPRLSLQLSAARQGGCDRPLRPRWPGPNLGGARRTRAHRPTLRPTRIPQVGTIRCSLAVLGPIKSA